MSGYQNNATGGASGVSKIIAGTGITISPAGGTGNVTINATGGGGGVTSFNTRTGAITLSNTDVATILASFTGTAGVSIIDSTGDGITVEDAGGGGLQLVTTGEMVLTATGSGGIAVSTPANGFALFTAANLAGLPVPPSAPAFGFTQDGKIYYYPPGGPWALVAPSGGGGTTVPGQYTTSTVTADPAPTAAAAGTYYRLNYTGTFTLPSSGLVAGDWFKVKQIGATQVVTFTGTVDGNTGFYIANQYDEYELTWNGSSWDITGFYRLPTSIGALAITRQQSLDQMAPAAAGVNQNGQTAFDASESTNGTVQSGTVSGIVSGTKFQLPVLYKDAIIYVSSPTSNAFTSLTMGPSTGAEIALTGTSLVAAKDDLGGFLIPAGYSIILTVGNIADWTVSYVTK